jgi:hypothetical protein
MVSFVAHFHHTPTEEVLKMPTHKIHKWYNEALKLYNKMHKSD